MRLKFDHPAIVTGTWEDGSLRRQLVRVPSEFEIAEYSDAEAPVSFRIVEGETETVMKTFRTFGGRHYEKWTWDQPEYAFHSESSLMDSVYWGGHFHFSGLAMFVDKERKATTHLPTSANIVNGERKPTSSEANRGFTSHSVACKKAPYLKKSRWLGADTAEEVADWYAKTASVFSKIILVDGVPYVLSHEPCYCLTVSGMARSGYSRKGPASVSIGNVSVFGGDLDGPVFDKNSGLEVLPNTALVMGDQYFAADDYDNMTSFARESGWGISNDRKQTIKVLNPEAVSKDFADLETVRHARIVHDRAWLMSGHVKIQDWTETYRNRPVERDEMLTRMDRLGATILQWQEDRNGTDYITGPMEAVFGLMTQWEEGRTPYNSFNLPEQLTAFKVREDTVDVTVIPKPWSGPRV
jgi:hypothetical protein